MDVVLYLRYSSDRQTEQSIEGQRHVCEKYCADMGYTIVGEYADRALSASKDTDKRVEFQRMIADSEKKQWQAIVVYKLDRFARNRYDSATYKAKLKKNGVKVISATEAISDNPEGIILESVLEGMAEFYSKELAQKITRGMHESALKGNSCGGQISLGYKIENKKLVIDPKTAPIVRQAFEMYANGHTVTEICKVFNAAGYRTKSGSEFNKNSFHSMFRNRKYIGLYKFMEVEIEDGVPAIVDKETFEKVQAILNRKAQAPARGKAITDYILSGKVFCGHCNKLMIGTASTSHTGRKYFYYTCSGQRGHNGCTKTPIRKERLEEAVINDTLEMLTPEFIDYLAELALAEAVKEREQNTKIPSYKAEIAEYDKSIGRLIKLVENGAESPTLSQRLNELERAKREAERNLAREDAEYRMLDKEQIVYFLTQMTKGDKSDPDFQRRLVDMLVNSVIVWDSEDKDDNTQDVTITYNIVPKKTRKIKVGDIENARCVFHPDKTTITSKYAPYFVGKTVFAINVKHRFD